MLSLRRAFLGMSMLLIALIAVACGSANALPGTLSVVADANGQQVEYNGHLLYRFSGDTAPGQTHGEGIKGIWFVATTTLSSQGAPQATPTQNGYGYQGIVLFRSFR